MLKLPLKERIILIMNKRICYIIRRRKIARRRARKFQRQVEDCFKLLDTIPEHAQYYENK